MWLTDLRVNIDPDFVWLHTLAFKYPEVLVEITSRICDSDWVIGAL